jgi:hypothetical protein
MLKMWRKLDIFLDNHLPLLGLFLTITILRIPNFFEPYWYGDEGIYLTIGTAMRHGEKLYSQIIDHKTPLIYYLAMVPSQLDFRILNFVAMIIATFAFWLLAKKLFQNQKIAFLSSFLFVLGTTLPAFEGNIPNGELFVMTFFLIGTLFLTKTHYFEKFISERPHSTNPGMREYILLLLSGVFFSLGILTKVPAIFDVAAFLSIGWFSLTLSLKKLSFTSASLKSIREVVLQEAALVVGIVLPILLSIVYFILRGSGKAYLDFGLLYNFRYAGEWSLPFNHPFLLFLFTLKGKLLLTAIWFILLTIAQKFWHFSHRFVFISGWFALALFGSLLSNRPYPHYFLQIFPALSLLIGFILVEIFSHGKEFISKIELVLSILAFTVLVSVVLLLQVKPYPTWSYYSRFVALMTKRITPEAYRNSFNEVMADNYAAAKIIQTDKNPKMFIWGTNPMLYALTQKDPVGRFTVAFHIFDFNAEKETYDAVTAAKPTYIVVMKGERDLPGLSEFLTSYYIPNQEFDHFVLWKRWQTQGESLAPQPKLLTPGKSSSVTRSSSPASTASPVAPMGKNNNQNKTIPTPTPNPNSQKPEKSK